MCVSFPQTTKMRLTRLQALNRTTVGTAVLGYYPVGMHYVRLVEENVDLPQQEAHMSLSEFVFDRSDVAIR